MYEKIPERGDARELWLKRTGFGAEGSTRRDACDRSPFTGFCGMDGAKLDLYAEFTTAGNEIKAKAVCPECGREVERVLYDNEILADRNAEILRANKREPVNAFTGYIFPAFQNYHKTRDHYGREYVNGQRVDTLV